MSYSRLVKAWVLVVAVSAGAAMAQGDAIVATGTFHGAVHKCDGRATIYKTANGEVLRLTHFKTSNGPDLHVILIAASDGEDNENFLDKKIERIELGPLKGNEGDQNYAIPAGTDLNKFKAVSIYCVRFNANFGTAPLEK
jgi:Electron transfer DM13